MDFVGDTSTGPKQLKKNCIRGNVPEVQKRDRNRYSFSLTRRANKNASLLLKNNVAAHIIGNDVIANNIRDGNLQSASREITDSCFQNEDFVYEETAAVIDAKPQNAVNDRYAVHNINDGESSNFEETMDTGNNSNNTTQHRKLGRKKLRKYRSLKTIYKGIGGSFLDETSDNSDEFSINASIELNTANCKNITQHRKLGRKKLCKYRLLKNIYKGVGGSLLDETSDNSDEFSINPKNDSDTDPLNTVNEKKKGVPHNCTNRGALKEKRRRTQAVKPSFVGDKRTKHVAEGSCSKDSELGSTNRNGLRKKKFENMQVTNKMKRSTTEIIVYKNLGAASLYDQENTSEIQKDSPLSTGNKRNRESTQEEIATMILKLRDGTQRHFTEEENRSRSIHVLRNVQLVQPTKAISNNIEIASGSVQNRIRESSASLSNTETMVASLLIELAARVYTTSKNTSTIKPISYLSKGKQLCQLDGNGPQAACGKQNESGISVCVVNRNPSEFSTVEAKKFMRCGSLVAKSGK